MIKLLDASIKEVEKRALQKQRKAQKGGPANAAAPEKTEGEEEEDESNMTELQKKLRAAKKARAKQAPSNADDDEDDVFPYDPAKDHFVTAMMISFPSLLLCVVFSLSLVIAVVAP